MYDAGKIDKLSRLLFSFGKGVSFFMVVVCCIAFVVGLVNYLGAAPDRLEAPEFEEFMPYLKLPGTESLNQDFSKIDTRRAIENKYNEHLKGIVTKYKYDTEFYRQMVDWMSMVPPNRRTRFVHGLDMFLEGFSEWLESNKESLQLQQSEVRQLYRNMADRYQTIFTELLRKEENRWQASYQERTNLLLFIVGTLIFLVLFLLVPIALKIEENTRFFK